MENYYNNYKQKDLENYEKKFSKINNYFYDLNETKLIKKTFSIFL